MTFEILQAHIKTMKQGFLKYRDLHRNHHRSFRDESALTIVKQIQHTRKNLLEQYEAIQSDIHVLSPGPLRLHLHPAVHHDIYLRALSTDSSARHCDDVLEDLEHILVNLQASNQHTDFPDSPPESPERDTPTTPLSFGSLGHLGHSDLRPSHLSSKQFMESDDQCTEEDFDTSSLSNTIKPVERQRRGLRNHRSSQMTHLDTSAKKTQMTKKSKWPKPSSDHNPTIGRI